MFVPAHMHTLLCVSTDSCTEIPSLLWLTPLVSVFVFVLNFPCLLYNQAWVFFCLFDCIVRLSLMMLLIISPLFFGQRLK
ncbi:hypothetical protein WN943_015492 [Citrus x changshan-huyou]